MKMEIPGPQIRPSDKRAEIGGEPGRKGFRGMTIRIAVRAACCMLLSGVVLYWAGHWGWLPGAIFIGGMALALSLRLEANRQVQEIGLLERFNDSLPGMIYQCRLYPTGRCSITYANDAIRWIYEKELHEVEHDCSSLLDLLHPDDRKQIEKSLQHSAIHAAAWKGEYRVVLPRQGVRWRFAQARVERLIDGSTLWHGFIADITARKEADQRLLESKQREAAALRRLISEETQRLDQLLRANVSLREEATHDHLTGVFLRRYFDSRYPEIFEDVKLRRPLTVMLCDIDLFKEFNDTFGHQAGDRCLIEVAQFLSSKVNRNGQILARYGGEEFIAVLPGLSSLRAEIVAGQLRHGVECLGIKAPGNRTVTVSIGVACLDIVTKEMKSDALLRAADSALYQAKNSGRNCCRILRREMKDEFEI